MKMTTKERILKAIEVLKSNGIKGTIKDVYTEGNNVIFKLQERNDWDISDYTVNMRTMEVA